MAFIRSETNMARHPNTRKLARELNISVAAAIGHVHIFWHWCMDFAEDGDVSRFDAEDIASAAWWKSCYTADANDFCKVLVQCNFLIVSEDQETMTVANWDFINPNQVNYQIRKEWGTIRANVTPIIFKRDGAYCKHCGTDSNLTIDHIFPICKGGLNNMENLQVLCQSCNSRKGGKI